jgi:hypothetical protein
LDLLLDNTNGTSLLEKFYKTYRAHLTAHPSLAVKLSLVTNWGIDPADHILATRNNENEQLGEDIYTATPRSNIGKKLKRIGKALKATDDEVKGFLKVLCFSIGRECTDTFKKVVADRMEWMGLKHDDNALAVCAQMVRDWIKNQQPEVDLNILQTKLREKDLYLPPEGLPIATVYLTTIKSHRFDVPPDYHIDLQRFYAEKGAIKGHELLPGFDYNSHLLPEIVGMQKKVNTDTGATLIRARGFARLSPWFAFGHTFSGVSGYTIEVNQNDALWRTDTQPNPGFTLLSTNGDGDRFDCTSGNVAVGLSVTGSLEADVRAHIGRHGNVDALLMMQPERGPGPACLSGAGDLAAMALQFKQLTRDFVKRNNAKRLFVYYFGPLSGACFIGHQLNAVCPGVQIMENLGNQEYLPAFLLV